MCVSVCKVPVLVSQIRPVGVPVVDEETPRPAVSVSVDEDQSETSGFQEPSARPDDGGISASSSHPSASGGSSGGSASARCPRPAAGDSSSTTRRPVQFHLPRPYGFERVGAFDRRLWGQAAACAEGDPCPMDELACTTHPICRRKGWSHLRYEWEVRNRWRWHVDTEVAARDDLSWDL